jgi:membrane fusion protein, multidrug efflux system
MKNNRTFMWDYFSLSHLRRNSSHRISSKETTCFRCRRASGSCTNAAQKGEATFTAAPKHLVAFTAALFFLLPGSGHAETLSARGIVKAKTEATIAMDYAARIKHMPKRDGEAFKAGDLLISFDCRRFIAEVNASKAAMRGRELVMTNNRKLLQRGAVGANEVKISEAEFMRAQADVMALQVRMGGCEFRAPFDGLLVERIAQEHESPAANQPLIKIVDTTRLEVEVIVPSKWLVWLKPGEGFDFQIDETATAVEAKVVRLGAVVDPISQTIKAYGVLQDKDLSVLPGMSGTAAFHQAGS